jgi:hypothetical protein
MGDQEKREIAARAIWIYAKYMSGRDGQWVGSPEKPLKDEQEAIRTGKRDAVLRQAGVLD